MTGFRIEIDAEALATRGDQQMKAQLVETTAKRLAGEIAIQACRILDHVPAYERAHTDPDDGQLVPGRWYLCGDWGCRAGLSRLWARWGDLSHPPEH